MKRILFYAIALLYSAVSKNKYCVFMTLSQSPPQRGRGYFPSPLMWKDRMGSVMYHKKYFFKLQPYLFDVARDYGFEAMFQPVGIGLYSPH